MKKESDSGPGRGFYDTYRDHLGTRLKLAQEQFDEFLENHRTGSKGRPDTPKGKLRIKKVEESIKIYGENSLLTACEDEYLSGNAMLVETINTLNEMGINTKSDLLRLDIWEARKYKGFGKQRRQTARLLQNLIAAEIAAR